MTEFNSQQPKQTFVISYASDFLWHNAAHLIMQTRGALTMQQGRAWGRGSDCKPLGPSKCGVTCNYYYYLQNSLKAYCGVAVHWFLCTGVCRYSECFVLATVPMPWNIQHMKHFLWCRVGSFRSDLISSDLIALVLCSSQGRTELGEARIPHNQWMQLKTSDFSHFLPWIIDFLLFFIKAQIQKRINIIHRTFQSKLQVPHKAECQWKWLKNISEV